MANEKSVYNEMWKNYLREQEKEKKKILLDAEEK
jgi:hypothetical protein